MVSTDNKIMTIEKLHDAYVAFIFRTQNFVALRNKSLRARVSYNTAFAN